MWCDSMITLCSGMAQGGTEGLSSVTQSERKPAQGGGPVALGEGFQIKRNLSRGLWHGGEGVCQE